VRQAVRVIEVQVGQDDGPHGGRIEAEALELRADLLLGRDSEADAEAIPH
jgi:hypothetical protein